VFENRVLRRIFGPKRDEITGEWRKLDNEELNNLYTANQIEKNEMGGECSTYGEAKAHAEFWGKPEGKISLGRPRRRWEDNSKMYLQEVECWGMNWNELAQDRDRWWGLVSALMILRFP